MGKITEISPQAKDKTRVNVYIEGKFACGLSLETAVKHRLKAGAEIDEARLREIEFDSEKQAALEKAAAHISKSAKTARELALFLSRKGYGEAVVSFILEKFSEYGYIDDGAYARAYVAAHGKKKGARLMKAELRAKGVADEDIAAAFAEAPPAESAAKAVAEKYMRGKGREPKDIQKLYRHLLSKGFSWEEAASAAEEYKSPQED